MRVTLQVALPDAEPFEVPSLSEFQRWADLTADESGEVCVRVVDGYEALQLNWQYRHRPYATNVLSFPFESSVSLTVPLLGDVVMTAPIIFREAHDQGKTIKSHWAHMFIHGLLHLKGYDHQEVEQAQQMEDYEVRVLNLLGFPNPYMAVNE